MKTRHQITKEDLDQIRFCYKVTFAALGSLGHDKLFDILVLD
jgi:hypothetical protein